MLAGGQTGLWVVVRQRLGNGDDSTNDAIDLWGARLQQGNEVKRGWRRRWAWGTPHMNPGEPAALP
jgi:hypothetical protein